MDSAEKHPPVHSVCQGIKETSDYTAGREFGQLVINERGTINQAGISIKQDCLKYSYVPITRRFRIFQDDKRSDFSFYGKRTSFVVQDKWPFGRDAAN
jgi:hypothetical protein